MTKEEEHNKVINFGCRLNLVESEIIKKLVKKSDHKNLIILNSCAVTNEAERKLKQTIRSNFKKNSEAKIIVTGCAAQIDPAKYSKMPEVAMVIGNHEKLKEESYQNLGQKSQNSGQNIIQDQTILHQDRLFFENQKKDGNFEKILVNDIMSVKDTANHLITHFEEKSRAFLQIQNGCNHRCTFCIIPYSRGNSRSVPFGDIANQTRLLVKNGYNEIVLTGVDITDYGKDLISGLSLFSMIKRLLKLVPELPRLRLSSIDVAEIDEDFYDLLQNEARFMPYFHISLQSGDDMILKRMKRRHKRQDVLDFCQKVRNIRPNATFGSDIIAGFPTETEEMFENSFNLIKEADLIFNHIFPFSAKSGTPAAKMPQLPLKIRKERAEKLRKATEISHNNFVQKMLGTKQKVIIEDGNFGRCENFIKVKLPDGGSYNRGEIVEIELKNILR
jgi:threonylcarbamoyladenosine tRNA methylthiotransferase MtaB